MANWRCGASRSLPLNTEREWVGQSAEDSIFSAYGWPDNPHPEQARKAFLLYDAESDPALKGGYSLPFGMVIDGTLTALISGCRASASRLPQKESVSDGERNKARAVLNAYFAKADENEKATAADDRALSPVFAFPVRVVRAGDTAGLLKKLRASVADPSIFEEAPPFFWTSEASSSRMDSYHTHMLPSSLRNFAVDMQDGVSFQNSHRTFELGFGRSLDGRFIAGSGNGIARAEGDFYTIPGLNLNGVATDDLIRGIRTGLVADNSVGFSFGPEGRFVCDIDGGDVMDCGHYPGLRYEVEGKKERVLATAGIDNAHMAELSAVYDGATPGAGVIKAMRASEAGQLEPQLARLLESHYRIKLPASHRSWAGVDWSREADLSRQEERPMPDEPTPTLESVPTASLRALLTEAALPPGADPLADVRALVAEVRALRPLKAENERLAPLADLGRQYHADLLQATLDEGVRAQGNSYPLETQRALLAGATIEQLKCVRDSYTAQAAALLAGGRTTQEKPEPPPPAESASPRVNPAHFRA